jgi:hypothetical protein
MPNTVDISLLEAALIGYESERRKIQEKGQVKLKSFADEIAASGSTVVTDFVW